MGHHRFILAGLSGALVLGLGGCGFSPLYSTAGYDRLGGVSVEAGEERFDYLLQDAVRDFAGPGDSPYRLRLQTRIIEAAAGVSPTGIATRVTLTGSALYTLEGDGAVTGSAEATVGFDRPSDPYAQIAARGAAEERLATRLAEEVMQDLAIELRRREAGLAR